MGYQSAAGFISSAPNYAAAGHLTRPNEHGPGKGEHAPKLPVDVAGSDLSEVAEKLGA